jgi:tetratricopeptide (TPR) repeat protein
MSDLEAPASTTPATESSPATAPAPASAWSTVPVDVLLALRAGALLGSSFTADAVAALLRCDSLAVLERLQQASDLGVTLVDAGADAFSLPPAVQAELTDSLMPALARAWRARLAASTPTTAATSGPVDATPVVAANTPAAAAEPAVAAAPAAATSPPAADTPAADASQPAAAAPEPVKPAAPEPVKPPPAPAPVKPEPVKPAAPEPVKPEPVKPAAPEPVKPAPAPVKPEPVKPSATPEPTLELTLDQFTEIAADMFVTTDKPRVPPSSPPPTQKPQRTRDAGPMIPRLEDQGEHLDLDFLSIAREAADRGDTRTASETLRRALGQLGARPASAAHLRLRILGQIELGRLQWQAAGPELGFTLNQALGTLDAVRAEFGADASSDIAVELSQVIAGVCFDLGDMGSLARAFEELTVASRLLQSEGETLRAARLLNEQAAVLMRMGEVSRAKDLLRDSRAVFSARDPEDPVTTRELAETDHLMAWLPLYGTMVAGREQEGYRMGLERAAAAERGFRRLDDSRELARVWETMGRLERHMQRFEEAMQHLVAAGEVQHRLGDLTGLGRTMEAMSDVLGQIGRHAEAIELLRESVRFNHDKGSLIGLFFNRRAFTDLAVRLGADPAHAGALGELARQLGTAERDVELGRSRSMA